MTFHTFLTQVELKLSLPDSSMARSIDGSICAFRREVLGFFEPKVSIAPLL